MERTFRAWKAPLIGLLVGGLMGWIIIVAAPPTWAGTPSTVGTTFWAVFQGNHTTSPALTARFVGREASTITTTFPAGTVTTGQATANTAFVISATSTHAIRDVSGSTVTKALMVESTAPGSLFLSNRLSGSAAGTVAIPANSLGHRYRAVSYEDYGSPSARLIVTATVAASVTITPVHGLEGAPGGVPISKALATGESYTLTGGDLTGTLIISDQPIAVHVSHDCASLPDGGACDHMAAALPPTTAWGRVVPVVRFLNDEQEERGDLVRIVADLDDTNVTVEGQSITLGAGGSWLGRIFGDDGSEATLITADKPILVTQFLGAGAYGPDARSGDPDMVVLTPAEQMLDQFLFTTPGTLFAYNALSVAIPTAATASFRLNGAALPPGSFEAISGTPFSFLQRAITNGVHSLQADEPFSALVYGVNSGNSYSYPAGFAVKDLTQPDPDPSESLADDASPTPSDSSTIAPSQTSSPLESASFSESPSSDPEPSQSESPTTSPPPDVEGGDVGGSGGGQSDGEAPPTQSPTPSIVGTTSSASSESPTASLTSPPPTMSLIPVATPSGTVTSTPTAKASTAKAKPTPKVAGKSTAKITVKPTAVKQSSVVARAVRPAVTISGFSAAATSLTPAQISTIARSAKALKPGTTVRCIGYSGTGGSAAALRAVGLSRARAVCSQFAQVTSVKTAVFYGGALSATSPAQETMNRKVIVRFG
jgi:outer membrane protein OmpA-like peptidoglycan-associated protein